MYRLELQLLFLVVIAPLIIAAMISDAKRCKLPNRIVVCIALLALTLHILIAGLDGLISAGLGMIIGFCALLPFYLIGMLGAGDIKFLGALGAFLGYQWILQATAAGVLLAGLCALIIILRQKREMAAERWALISAKVASLRMLTSDVASYKALAATHKSLPYGVYLGLAALGTSFYQIGTTVWGA